MYRARRIPYLKIAAACLALMVNMGYVIFSYQKAFQTLKNQESEQFLQTRNEVIEAVQNFSQYLNLTEARLSHSFHDPETISRILSENIEQVLGKSFQMIMSMTFSPTSDSTLVYTKFGQAFYKTAKQDEGIFYLGKGTVEWVKNLSSKSKQKLGTLDVVISLNKILYKNFSENEIGIFPADEVDLIKNPLSFKIEYLPYVVVLSGHSFTLWQFLVESKLHIFSIILFGVAVFFMGVAAGASVIQGAFVKQRAFNQKLVMSSPRE